MKKLKFDELSLSNEVLQAVSDMGFVEASPIQSEAIPYIMEGRDVIGQAQTGTGKTAAFAIPALEMIDEEDKSVQTLVLCPTRELAVQVTEEFKKLGKYKKNIHSVAIYGGDSIEKQILALRKGVQVVIGTPGRVMDHMERKTLRLDRVKMVVLDEADEMLDMGFREDIESILEQMPDERQTIFFSATMSKVIMQLTKKFQDDPQLVKVVKNELTAQNIEQLFFEVRPKAKVEVMTRLIDLYNLQLMLVFCNTKIRVDEVVEELQVRGYQAEGLHGDLRQQQRNNVMAKFRAGTTTILVATDVAARGIDVEDVDAVFNFDIPLDEEYYVHRIGRTGRAGKAGKAFTFVVGREIQRLREIQQYTKVKIQRGVIPSFEDIVGVKKAKFIMQIQEAIQEGGLEVFEDMIEQLHHAGFRNEDIITALIKMNMGIHKTEFAEMDLGGSDDRSAGRDKRSSDRDRDRGPRRDRDDRFSRDGRGGGRSRDNDRSSNASMVRLFINIGRDAKIRPGDIVGAIAGETGIAGNAIGSIDIYDKFTFVEVPKNDVQRVLKGMDNNSIKGKKVNIEIARQ